MITYRAAELGDAHWLAPRLRLADVAEVHAATGMGPDVVLPASWRASTVAVTCEVGGEPAAMFGVVPVSMLTGEGAVWMLGTPEVERHARALLVEAPQWLALIGDGYRLLRNRVDARNAKAIRWLRRMGFRFGEAAPHGPQGLPFLPFERAV